uniref:Secreted protein n=1 Tax=Macrostomum lignano TaxID=282301 RepID=A0A1I8INR2_9PLAT
CRCRCQFQAASSQQPDAESDLADARRPRCSGRPGAAAAAAAAACCTGAGRQLHLRCEDEGDRQGGVEGDRGCRMYVSRQSPAPGDRLRPRRSAPPPATRRHHRRLYLRRAEQTGTETLLLRCRLYRGEQLARAVLSRPARNHPGRSERLRRLRVRVRLWRSR